MNWISTNDRGHRALDFKIVGEGVIFRLVGNGLLKCVSDITDITAQGRHEFDFAVATEAGADFTIRGKASLVAGGLEVLTSNRSNEADVALAITKIPRGTMTGRLVGGWFERAMVCESHHRFVDG